VFSNQIPDPTKGASHYRTPDVSPDWSAGRTPVATIGGHLFYKIPLTASNTAGTVVVSPSTVGQGERLRPRRWLRWRHIGDERRRADAQGGERRSRKTILAKCKIFLRAGGTCERGFRRGTGGAIRSTAIIGGCCTLRGRAGVAGRSVL
jgi:hypothetical protein